MSVFVTATDTDIGKTAVSAWICFWSSAKYWKPLQTGCEVSDFVSDSEIVKRFSPKTEIIPEAYRFQAPMSPYDAAKKERITIQKNNLYINESNVVIEGAGGIFVPIWSDCFMIDIPIYNRCKVVVVARSKIGMINHLLLTLFALFERKIPVVGVIIIGEIDPCIQDTLAPYLARVNTVVLLPETNDWMQILRKIPVPSKILEDLQ